MSNLQTYKCQNCSAVLRFDAGSRALTCDFCGSNYVAAPGAEGKAAGAERKIAPFAVDAARSVQLLQEWVGKGLFTPSDLKTRYSVSEQHGVYIPFWEIAADVETRWHGEYSETRTRRVSKTRAKDGGTEQYEEDEQYQVWHPRDGDHSARHRVFIAASGGLTQDEADALMPYPDEAMTAYSDDYIVGWKAEEPAIDREAAWGRAREKMEDLERQACAAFIERLNGVACSFGPESYWLALLPVWVYSYAYDGKRFRVLINGQTGEIKGTKPKSGWRIAFALVLAAVFLFLCVAAFFAWRR